MHYGRWVVRGMVGMVIGFTIGALGGDSSLVVMGGVLGLVPGLGFPDRSQPVQRQPPRAQAPEATPDPEVWPPPPNVKMLSKAGAERPKENQHL